MHANNNEKGGLDAALVALDATNRDVVALTITGFTLEARGAENAWLDGAIRAAMIPAETREAARRKIEMLSGNMDGWALQASKTNGRLGAASLIMGALAAEAHAWGLEAEHAEGLLDRPQAVVVVDLDSKALAGYRKDARPRHLGRALRRYEAAVAEVDRLLACGKDNSLFANALHRSRDALLDVVSISTRNLAELKRKQRAYLAYRARLDHSGWLMGHGMTVAFNIDYMQLELPPAEVQRLKAMFPNPWTSNDRPTEAEWLRHNRAP